MSNVINHLVGIDLKSVTAIHVCNPVEKEWDGSRWKQAELRFRFADGSHYTMKAYSDHRRGEQPTADLVVTVGGCEE